MVVHITPATSGDQPVLRNLLQLYLHDFSELLGATPDSCGLFDYPHFDAYWTDAGRKPFLLDADGRVAGFAFVRTASVLTGATEIADMAEFFVVRGLRRRGVGRAAASALFARFPGKWEVRVMERHAAALAFWSAVIDDVAHGRTERLGWVNDGGVRFSVFRFETDHRSGEAKGVAL
jgi:predicted acetyltransferase